MTSEDETSINEGYGSSNEGYNNANVLQIRLNTDPVLEKVYEYLSGEKVIPTINEDKIPVLQTVKVAESKANKEGVHSVMIWLSSLINSQIVQGNIESFSEKDNKVADFREDFCEYIMKNLILWEIKEKEFEGIIDIAVTQMDLFLSRLVGNKERDSYNSTIKHTESSSSQVRGSRGFKIPGF